MGKDFRALQYIQLNDNQFKNYSAWECLSRQLKILKHKVSANCKWYASGDAKNQNCRQNTWHVYVSFKKSFKKEHVIAFFSRNFNLLLHSCLVTKLLFLNLYSSVSVLFWNGVKQKTKQQESTSQNHSWFCLNFCKLLFLSQILSIKSFNFRKL